MLCSILSFSDKLQSYFTRWNISLIMLKYEENVFTVMILDHKFFRTIFNQQLFLYWFENKVAGFLFGESKHYKIIPKPISNFIFYLNSMNQMLWKWTWNSFDTCKLHYFTNLLITIVHLKNSLISYFLYEKTQTLTNSDPETKNKTKF